VVRSLKKDLEVVSLDEISEEQYDDFVEKTGN
jgi:hypothetical protein